MFEKAILIWHCRPSIHLGRPHDQFTFDAPLAANSPAELSLQHCYHRHLNLAAPCLSDAAQVPLEELIINALSVPTVCL